MVKLFSHAEIDGYIIAMMKRNEGRARSVDIANELVKKEVITASGKKGGNHKPANLQQAAINRLITSGKIIRLQTSLYELVKSNPKSENVENTPKPTPNGDGEKARHPAETQV